MARRFRFRLAAVAKLREQQQKAQRRTVAEALTAVSRIQHAIDGLHGQLGGSMLEIRRHRHGAVLDVSELSRQQLHRGWLHRELTRAGDELTRRRLDLEAQRLKLSDVTKQRKTIENLRKKQWQRHVRDGARDEQTAADEAANSGYLRRRSQAVGQGGIT